MPYIILYIDGKQYAKREISIPDYKQIGFEKNFRLRELYVQDEVKKMKNEIREFVKENNAEYTIFVYFESRLIEDCENKK